MGFLSKLFSKRENVPSATVKVTTKVNNEPYNPDIPPFQGDYAKTIFLWAHEKASAVRKNDDYARYFLYECGISNPSAYHRELIRAGCFEKAPATAILNSLKVADLKQFLSSIGQVSTGKKDVLIERIIQNADESSLATLCPEELYVLSEIGRAFLEEHYDYVMVHKHKNWGIDWKEYDAYTGAAAVIRNGGDLLTGTMKTVQAVIQAVMIAFGYIMAVSLFAIAEGGII